MRGVLIFFILLISLHTVTATTLLVDPTRIINTSLTPGSKFTVNVNVSDVIDLASYQFKLSFNNSILNATVITSINKIWQCYNHNIDNSNGIIQVDCELDGPLNGNVKLEAINFSVIGIGESNLHLNETLLGDSQGMPMTHDINDGFFSNKPSGTCVKSNPTVTLSPQLQSGIPGSIFYNTVNVINNDNNYCDSSIFSLAYQCPSTWSCSLNKNSILIYPQLNDSSTILTINSSVSATLGNYTVNITATNNSYTNKSSTNITIISLGNKTTITAGADSYTVERYQNTTLWCDYRNATSNSEILGANVEFQVIINSTYTINYTGIYNTTNNVYEYSYNSTYPGWDAVRCNASATNYEYNFATFSLVTCGISPQLTLSPAYQSGNVGSALNYTVEVYDADVPGICGNSTYNLSVKGLPTGWDYSFFSNIFNLDAATSNSTNLTLTSSALASSGNYTINVTATNIKNNIYETIGSIIYNVTGGLVSSTTTSTITIQPPRWGPTYDHTPSSPNVGQDVTISVDWFSDSSLNSVIIYENSSGSYQTHVCNLNTHQCSGEEIILRTNVLPSIILVLSGSLTFIAVKLKKLKKLNKVMLYFVCIIVIIIVISVFMFPKISKNISNLSRLGIFQILGGPTTFTHLIPGSQLNTPGMVVGYYSFANDSAGNYNMTNMTVPIKTFIVQAASTTTTTITSTTTTSTLTTTTSTTTTVPSNTETRLYLNGTEGNFYYVNNTYANFTVWVNVSGTVYLDTNITNWTTSSGNSPFTQIVQLNATQNDTYYNITGYFIGNATHNASSQVHYAIVYVTTTITTTIPTTTISVVYHGGGGGGGGGKITTTTTTLTTTLTTTSSSTTIKTTTVYTTTTTISSCKSSGYSCESYSDCCSAYCCNNVCSDLQCAKKTELIKYIIIIYALLLGIISGYYLYLKEIKTNLNKPKLTAPIQEKIPSIPIENIKKELTYLKNIAQNLKKRGYDVSGSEVELLSTEYYLKRNSPDLAASHLEKAKENLKNFFK